MSKPRSKKPAIKLLGKPISHWETEARKLVVDILVRHGRTYAPGEGRNVSVIHEIASRQLLALAAAIGEREASEAHETLDRLSAGLASVVAAVHGRAVAAP